MRSKNGEEVGEVHSAVSVGVDLVDHVPEFGLCEPLAKKVQDGNDVLGGDGSIAVLVEEGEDVLQFGNLSFGGSKALKMTERVW